MKSIRPFLGFCCALALAACTNPVTPDPPAEPPAASTAAAFGGYYADGTRTVACYWQGEARHSLGAGLAGTSLAHASTVSSGGTVYAAGYYVDGLKRLPCYWAGDSLVTLKGADGVSDLANGGEAKGIALSGGKVYTVGFYYVGDGPMPCYWEGSTCHALALPSGASTIFALSIAVSATGTVYAAGYYYDSNDSAVPCCWEGDSFHDLKAGTPEGSIPFPAPPVG